MTTQLLIAIAVICSNGGITEKFIDIKNKCMAEMIQCFDRETQSDMEMDRTQEGSRIVSECIKTKGRK